ncbi:MAG: hypothetical protein BGO39_19550 [Chloroflexi bacterium 54-19]|nr:MAG: hypothetical protein BGO39_19550 [Chloroflexi bacterium 54-19]
MNSVKSRCYDNAVIEAKRRPGRAGNFYSSPNTAYLPAIFGNFSHQNRSFNFFTTLLEPDMVKSATLRWFSLYICSDQRPSLVSLPSRSLPRAKYRSGLTGHGRIFAPTLEAQPDFYS